MLNEIFGFFVNTSIEEKLERLIANKRYDKPKDRDSYLYGTSYILSIVERLYQKVKFSKQTLFEMNEVFNTNVLYDFLSSVEENSGVEFQKRNNISIEDVFDMYKSIDTKTDSIDYESFITGVQLVVELLLNAYRDKRVEKYRNLIDVIAMNDVNKALKYIRSLK